MNIAFDAGAIEIAKGSGVGNYTLNQFKAMIHSASNNQYYYFNTICQSELIRPLEADNFKEVFYFMGRNDVLREYDGQYSDLYGQLVKSFIKKYKIDVFYITSPFLAENVIYRKEWFENVVVVGTAYDIIPYIMKEKYLASKYLMKWYMSCIDMLRWCDRQLAISQSVKDDMIQYLNFDSEKIDIIYGGVSDKYCEKEYSEQEKNELYQKYGIKSKYIMCGISADQRKNVAGAIDAYALLPKKLKQEYQLVIVGRVLQESMQQYQNQINGLDEKGNVILTNYVTDEDLIKLYNFSKLMLFPSLYEGFGLPLIEAWACGTPVVASNNSSLGELAKGAGVLFDPTDVKDIARGIEEALTTADLDTLLENGRKKLDIFTWENVAALTLSSIDKACSVKQDVIEERQRKIACVFLDNAFCIEGWSEFFNLIRDNADISIFNLGAMTHSDVLPRYIMPYDKFVKSYKKFDDIFYMISSKIKNEHIKEIKKYKGSVILINQQALYIVNSLTANQPSDYAGVLISESLNHYFDHKIQKNTFLCLKDALDKIITFGDTEKEKIMNQTLEIPIINIAPGLKEQACEAIDGEGVQAIALNLLKASAASKPSKSTRYWADKLIEEEILSKQYTSDEMKALSKTLAMAISMESDMVYCKDIVKKEDQIQKNIAIDMITTWNTKCGIAEFTKYFVQNTEEYVRYTIFPDISVSMTRQDENFVAPRTWKQYNNNFSELMAELKKSESSIIHIQYNFGFFSLENVGRLISELSDKKVIIDFHATKMITETLSKNILKKIISLLNKAYQIVVHQQEDIKVLTDVGIERELICVIPLGQTIWKERSINDCKTWLNISSKHVIGSYGFMLPHKGIEKVIEAVAKLKEIYPDILYIVSCALYEADVSKEYLLKCKSLTKSLGVEDHVVFISDFLEPEESAILLQACDALAMVYSPTNESASGAIRFCMSAMRPIITTKQPIFDEYSDCTLQIESNEPELIVNALKELFEDSGKEYLQKVKAKIMETSWSVVGKKYLDLYESE